MPNKQIPNPWKSFLQDIDSQLTDKVEFHCLGGFVVKMIYDLPRVTEDVDVITIAPVNNRKQILVLAGKDSKLHHAHRIYLDYVTIVTLPENYDQRLTEMFPGTLQHIKLYALDSYDLALSKLERNSPKDREDVKYLARKTAMDLEILKKRYDVELRPYFGAPEKHDTTLKLWIEMIEEERNQ